MPLALPTPPPGSPLRVGYDEQGWVRLSWRPSYNWRSDLVAWAILTGLASVVVLLLFRAGQHGLAICFALSFSCTKVFHVLRQLRWERVSLGETVLRYEGHDPSALARAMCEVSRTDADPVRLEWVTEPRRTRARQRLTLGRGAGSVEIGWDLRPAEREWLAEVLRAWARAGEPPAPPHSIAVEYDGGVCRLHWEPNPLWLRSARRKTVVCLSTWLLGWGFGGMGLLLPTSIFLWGWLRWGMGCWAWFPLAALFPALWTWASAGHKAIRELRPLLRGPTEECLTLTPQVLHYQPGRSLDATRLVQLQECFKEPMTWRPGRYCEGEAFHSGLAREVPLSELRAVRLERTDHLPRLLLEHGAESFEVGRTLPEPDREWLAGVLRAWAGIGGERQAVEVGTATGPAQ